ncbi:MAG: quinol:electron acceptor oxidoreductase subunit ActD, partial [Verrucomicrobiota bacterium]
MKRSEKSLHGLGAEFPTAASLLHAAQKVQALGFRRWDVYSPFPVHGMDQAMGFRRSRVSLFSLIGGITGLCT